MRWCSEDTLLVVAGRYFCAGEPAVRDTVVGRGLPSDGEVHLARINSSESVVGIIPKDALLPLEQAVVGEA